MLARDRGNRGGSVVAKTGLAIGIALAGLPAVLPAQGYDLGPGVRIRVSIYRSPSPHPVSKTEGILLTQSTDSLYLSVGDHADTVAFPLGSGMKVEAVSGEAGHTWLGVAVGSVLGAVAGLAVSGGSDCPSTSTSRGGPGLCGDLAAFGGMFAGALIGGIVGSQIKKDRWTVFPRVGPAAGGAATSLGVTVRF